MAENTPHRLQCMEVWGGNQRADVGVSMLGLEAWVYSQPHADTGAAEPTHGGGDVHYLSSCASGCITRALLADVSGHGHQVAALATDLRDLMRSNVNQVSQQRVIAGVNEQFAHLTGDGLFATAVVLTYFAPRQELVLSSAGHPPPFVHRAATGTWSVLQTGEDDDHADHAELSNIPLGVVGSTRYSELTTHLAVDDMVLCYSDAFVEAHDASGRQLGVGGFLDVVRSLPAIPPAELVGVLLERMAERSADNLQQDDVTVMLLRRHEAATRPAVGRLLAAPFRILADRVKRAVRSGA